MRWAYRLWLSLALQSCAAALAAQTAPLTFQTVSTGLNANTCALTTSGAAYCWGVNLLGELGTAVRVAPCKDQTPCATHPIPVDGGHTFTAIAIGSWHACGLTAAGDVLCWGDDQLGELGSDAPRVACPTGTLTVCELVPVVVSGGKHYTAITTGEFHSCAIDTDGRAYCWGLNAEGQLGTDSTGETCQWHGDTIQIVPCWTAPRAVSDTLHFRSIAAGVTHTCGIAVDSLLYCWGNNQLGQVGLGGGGVEWQPTAVLPNVKVASVAAGGALTCAIESTGVLLCWGSFMVGPDLRVTDPTPKAIGDSTQHYIAVTVGGEHACALTSQGTIYCWGEGRQGQLGIGGFGIGGLVHVGRQGSNEPRKVSGDRSYKMVSAGGDHTCAVSSDGALYCWGTAQFGALGVGGDEKKSKPEAVRFH